MTGKLRLEWVDPRSLTENPRNWRRHTPKQTEALTAALERVGWAGALLYNERTGRLIDGHLRLDIARKRKELVPVLIGSWDEEEEKVILASLDPIAEMAQADAERFEALLEEIANQSHVDALLAEMIAEEKDIALMFISSEQDIADNRTGTPGVVSETHQSSKDSTATVSSAPEAKSREERNYVLSVVVSYEQKLLVEMAIESTGKSSGELLELGARVALGER